MKLVISGNTPSQKNGKEISGIKLIDRSRNLWQGKPFLRSNKRVKDWQEIAIQELSLQFHGYRVTGYPIDLNIVFYFDNERRHDLDNAAAGVMDALVKAGIIEDDNMKYVSCLTLQYGGVDKTNPRAEIYLDE